MGGGKVGEGSRGWEVGAGEGGGGGAGAVVGEGGRQLTDGEGGRGRMEQQEYRKQKGKVGVQHLTFGKHHSRSCIADEKSFKKPRQKCESLQILNGIFFGFVQSFSESGPNFGELI